MAVVRRMRRADGSPKGGLAEYLERARELQAIKDHPQAGLLPNPMAVHLREIPPETPVEEAEVIEKWANFQAG